ncbi:MAG: hypothetical protein H6Q89_2240 [Myxococcaceae bacterium]|nr:hypothetical protein [Myxococcaceae bacterium]
MNARGHLSSETIDLLMLSALDASAANAAKGHIDACATCRTRWRELNEDKEKFQQFVFPRTLEKVTSRVMAPSLFDRLRIFGPWKVLGPLAAAAAAAAVAIGVVNVDGPGTQTEDEVYIGLKGTKTAQQDIGLKGDARIALEVVAQRQAEGQFPVKPGSVLRPGDKIRFVVNPGSAKYLLIGSRDGSGAFTVYHPFGGDKSTAISRGSHELPGAVELDAVAGTEKLVAVFSNEPVDAKALKQAVDTNPAQPQLGDAKVISLDFVKAVK